MHEHCIRSCASVPLSYACAKGKDSVPLPALGVPGVRLKWLISEYGRQRKSETAATRAEEGKSIEAISSSHFVNPLLLSLVASATCGKKLRGR